MWIISKVVFVAATTVLLSATIDSGRAAGWRYFGGEAGLWVDGALNGIAIGCDAGSLSLRFFGFATRLEAGRSYSVVLTIDDTARRFRARVGEARAGAGSGLTMAVKGPEAASLIDALRRGRKAEIATPAGRYDLPLSGSSKALDALTQSVGCPG